MAYVTLETRLFKVTCQSCGAVEYDWDIHSARMHVGTLNYWHVQLCESCTARLEQAIRAALTRPSGPAQGEPVR
jgi:hypothetical protein